MINGSLTVPAVVLVAKGAVTVFLALPPLTLTGNSSLAASLAAMSTLPTEPGLDFQPAVDSFSPLWLHRPAPPYCGASHTNDRKATGSCLQRLLPPFGGTSQLLVGLPQVVHAHFNQLAQ